MARRICIMLGIILGVLWSCSKAPLPPEPEGENVTKDIGKIYITTVDENGQKIDQANIFVNGEYVGDTPLFIESLFFGTHTIRVQKNGYEIYSEMISIEHSLVINREIILHKLPLNTGQLLVTVNKDTAKTTITNSMNEIIEQSYSREISLKLDVGGYFIRCEKPGYILVNKAVQVRLDSIVVENIELIKLANTDLPQIALSLPEAGLMQSPILISWESANANRIDIDYIENAGLNGKREVIFKSPGTHIVRAIAYNDVGQTSVENSIIIDELPAIPPGIRVNFNPKRIYVNEVATINWHSSNATKVAIDYVPNPDLNGQWQAIFSTSGMIIINGYAYGPGGEAQTCDTLIVEHKIEPVPVIQVEVHPKQITIGQKALISWQSEYANSVDVDFVPNPGKNGQWQSQFSSVGQFVINAYAYGNGGQAYDADTIIVTHAVPPSLEFSATPGEVDFGKPVKLQWYTNGSQVAIDNGIGVRGPVGTDEIIFQNPGKKIITAVAYGQHSTTSIVMDSVFVREPEQPELPVISLSVVDSVTLGQPALIEWHSMNATAVDVDYVQSAGFNGKAEVSFQFPGERIISATAYNDAGQVTVYDTVIVVMEEISSQVESIFVTSGAKVCAIHPSGVQSMDAGTVDIKVDGYYRVTAVVWYNSGDEQKNESFFITMKDQGGVEHYPFDPNAGEYKVVPDDPGSPHVAERDAGLFYLAEGSYVIQLSHYYLIADQFPQFIVGNRIRDAESVQTFYYKFDYVRESFLAYATGF